MADGRVRTQVQAQPQAENSQKYLIQPRNTVFSLPLSIHPLLFPRVRSFKPAIWSVVCR